MKKMTLLACLVGFLMLAAGSSSAPMGGAGRNPGLAPPAAAKTPGLKVDFANIPLYFIANEGQVDGQALFYAKAARYTLWLTEEGLVFDSFKPRRPEASVPDRGHASPRDDGRIRPVEMERDVSRLVFLNASAHPEVVPADPAPLKVNYFRGADPDKWRTSVPTFGAVLYKNVYDRIDLKVYGIESRIEYDWIVRPGGDPRDIAVGYAGAEGTGLSPEGDLVIETGFGELTHRKPVAYQEGATRAAVVSAFRPIGENAYGFDVGPYDPGRDLVIDPVVLAYSSYLGGSGAEKAYDIAADGSGHAYITGYTDSGNFPTMGQYQTDLGLRDVFVAMLDTTQAGAASLVYSTYLGGNGTDVGTGIALDANGYVYVSGHTNSSDFPTFHPYQTDQAGADAFVAKLDPSQTGAASLLFSTYLGGNGNDYGWAIAADASGCAYVTGDQDSTDFPILNPYQTDQIQADVFVTKLDTTKSGTACLLYSTYLGGSASDFGYGIATDGIGGAYVTGYTVSSDFPTLNPYQTDQGVRDVFVTRLDTTKTGTASLAYSTFLGGNEDDYGMRIAAVGNGLVFVAGFTDSTDFPTLNPYQTDPGDATSDVFLAKIDTSQGGAPGLTYATYIGGAGADYGYSVAVDSGGVATVAGTTRSTNYPTTNAYQTDPGDGTSDAFVTRIDPAQIGAASLLYSTYLGGSATDEGQGVAMDSSGNVYVAGFTDSSGFPTLNPYQTDQSSTDGFVTKIYDNGLAESLTVTAPNGGESWEAGSSHFITWTTTGTVGNVRIEYSTDNGGSWTDVIASTANDGTHPWTVPSSISAQGLIRISQAAGGTPSDASNAAFSIIAGATITVTSPNGGESWEVGSAHNITWTSTGTVADVRIEYSTDNGGAWTDIVTSTTNDGTHSWTIPNAISQQGLVRITRIVGGIPSDASDAVFAIAAVPALMLTSPNGGESWDAGSVHNITWTSAGAVGDVRLQFSADNGGSWTDVAASTANDGTHPWTIPGSVSAQGLVRISQAAGGAPSDVSDAVFSILAAHTITLTSPNGGESWVAGSAHDITWTSTGAIANVKVEYSTNAGTDWTTIIASTANDGSHPWTVANAPSTNSLARVSEAGGTVSDASDAVFTILAAPSITVTSPNGGESWVAGSAHDITWTSTGAVANVKVEYSTNAGTDWTTIIASTANDGNHPWTVANAPSTNGLVRVSEAGGTVSDASDAVFTILAGPTITVTSPNGGEEWIVDSAHDITWTSTGTVGNVKVEYSTNAGTDWTTIIASTANDGSHSWTVANAPSANSLVRISEAGGTVSDTSDAVFAISLPPTLGLNRTRLNFGAQGGTTTSAQNVTLSNWGGATPHWTATPSAGWMTATPGTGTGPATVAIGVDPTGLAPGAYSGTVAFADPDATNSPQSVTVYLTVYNGTQPPFGDFATPTDGAAGVTGAIPVTGWVLDDIETTKVEIWRDPVLDAGELNSLYFVGYGLFVEGPRPDIETGYPASPLSYAAGWGYMLLTNFLPHQGNGTYKLYAIATDKEGNQVTLGTKTITCSNATAEKPFGTIDTPGQGGNASGNRFVNFGWVLTPLPKTIPFNGSTITVYVDSILLGNLSTSPNLYNAYRADVATNFPGLNNSGGPIGAFYIDTTGYANGVHTIWWIAFDDAGKGDGIGSRFFTIANVGGSPEPAAAPPATDPSLVPTSFAPVPVQTGLDLGAEFLPRYPGADGIVRIEIPEVNRVEIMLGAGAEAAALKPGEARFTGHMVVGNELRPLPVGSTLDRRSGRFSWMPGPGFLGTYELVFTEHEGTAAVAKFGFKITVTPKSRR